MHFLCISLLYIMYIVLFTSTSGLYLTGGLTPKNIEYITGTKPGTENLFLGALLDKVHLLIRFDKIAVHSCEI